MVINKRFFMVIFTVVVLLTSANFAFANTLDDEKQIESIKLSAQKSFEAHKGALEVDKNNFGLTESESFSNATLGNGYPYYVISSDFLNNQNSENVLSFSGYIFPIKVASKTAGIAIVREIDGKWNVDEMISNSLFEKDIADAKKVFNKNTSTKIVFDDYLHLYALVDQKASDYTVLPMKDNAALDLNKHQEKLLSQSAEKIRLYHNERMNNMKLGGGGDETLDKRGLNYIILGAAVIAIFVTFFIVIRRKMSAA